MDVLRLDLWRESQAGLGRFRVLLLNTGNKYGDKFLPQEDCEFRIDNVSLMKGYVDDVNPYVDDEADTYQELIEVAGRDCGQDLANLFLEKEYVDKTVDDIFADALASSGSEITYTSASILPKRTFGFQRTFLIDGFREMAQSVDADFYVADDKTLHLFTLGAPSEATGVTLKSLLGDSGNNILRMQLGYREGFTIKNYVHVLSGAVNDHYTEGNGEDWVTDKGYGSKEEINDCDSSSDWSKSIASDAITVDPSVKKEGSASLRWTIDRTVGGDHQLTYNPAAAINFSVKTLLCLWLYSPNTGKTGYIRFVDGSGNYNQYNLIFNWFGWYWRRIVVSAYDSQSPTPPNLSNIDQIIINYNQGTAESGTVYVYIDYVFSATDSCVNELSQVMVGKGSVRSYAEEGENRLYILFPKYNYDYLDFSGITADRVGCWVRVVCSDPRGNFILTDTDGNVIISDSTNSKTPIYNGEWRFWECPVGARVGIDGPDDEWDYFAGTSFNWKVKKIAVSVGGVNQCTDLIIDGLGLPNIRAKAIKMDAPSQANYRKRMHAETRTDLASQKALEEYAETILARRKDPSQSLEVTVAGNTDLKYAGQTLTVNAPSSGINSQVYRIVSLHHVFADGAWKDGSRHVTELRLIKHDVGGTQKSDPLRVLLRSDPDTMMVEAIGRRLGYLERAR